MKCQKCIEENKTSRIFIGGSMSTLLHSSNYFDEEGVMHNHNPNKITSTYQCSNGHRWTEDGYENCKNCDYGHAEKVVTYYS